MTQGTSGYVKVGSSKLYFEVAGAGKPLVLAHAGFVDSRMWNDQWAAFSQHYRVIRFDLRGFGKSDPVDAPINRRDDLYQLLTHLGVTRAALLGCSLSGAMILDFALEHPEMVSALVVVSTAPNGFELHGAPPTELFEMMAAVEQGDVARASELQNRIWIDGPFRQPEQVDAGIRERAGEMNRIALTNGTWKADLAPLEPLDPPAAQRLREVHVPTLIVAGALDHPEILRAADLLTAEIPDAGKVIMPDCAHIPNMERPREFNHVVLDFLHSIK